MKAEYQGNEGFLQRDSVEHKGYAEAQSTDRREGKERDSASDLLEAILDRDNLNRAYKRVKRNRDAAGIDGMTAEEALPWLKEHRGELLQSIRDGSYMPSPVRRKEIPKPDGSVRKLGIPTVVDRVIQQAIAQKLQSIWEPLQTKGSQQRDTLVSSTTTSPCTYAVEPPCTGRYARWCERSAIYLREPPTRLRHLTEEY